MKRFIQTVLATAAAAVVLQGCSTLKPLAESVSEPDYNQRITVTNPQYKKAPNALGYVFNLALPAAGAFAGMMYLPAVMVYDETSGAPATSDIGNAVLGGLAGLGVANMADAIAGYGSIISSNNNTKWVRKACGNNYFILNDSGNTIEIININAESAFSVKDKKDVKDFLFAFPDSKFSADVFDKAMAALPRSSYPWLIDSFSGKDFTLKAKQAFIDNAGNFGELDEALKKYGYDTGMNSTATKEKMYFSFVKDCDSAIEFHKRFPGTDLSKKALGIALATELSASQVSSLQSAYGQEFNLTAEDFKELGGDSAKNYYNAMYTKAGIGNESAYHKFVEEYAWIDYPGKKDDVLSKAWDFVYARVTDGKDAVYAIEDIYKKSYAKKIGLDKDYVYDWAIDKAARTIHEGISLGNLYTQSSLSPEFGRWFSAEHTAGQVSEEGEIKFVVYGDVKNTSKFSVPLDLVMSVDINKVNDVNLNMGGGILGSLLSAGAAALGHREELYKRVDDIVYSIPQLNAGESDYFAFVIDLGEGEMASGLNLGDRLKVASQLAVGNVHYTPKVRSGKPSEEQIAKQYEAMSIASHGLPKGKVIDLDNLSWLWGEGYSTLDQGYYDAEGAKIRAKEEAEEAAKKAAEEAAKEEAENFNHCTVHLFFKDGTDLVNESFVVSGTRGLLFKDDYTFTTDSNGIARLRWPKSDPAITEIHIFLELFSHWDYDIKDLNLTDGGHYEILIDR